MQHTNYQFIKSVFLLCITQDIDVEAMRWKARYQRGKINVQHIMLKK
jgi:hypothetical protein